MTARIPLIRDGESYLLQDASGRTVRLIEEIGEGGTYQAYKGVEEVDGVPQKVCVILEWNPAYEEDTFSLIQYAQKLRLSVEIEPGNH